jgi:hypothetical protein
LYKFSILNLLDVTSILFTGISLKSLNYKQFLRSPIKDFTFSINCYKAES